MKLPILLYLLAMLWTTQALAQRPWVAAGTEWQMINHQSSPWQPYPYFAVCKDTVLRQGIWCSVIEPYFNCSPMSLSKQYIYEQDRRVFFEHQGSFYLIFDHNKVAGETYLTHFLRQDNKLDSAWVTIDSVYTLAGDCPSVVQVPLDTSFVPINYTDRIVEGRGYYRTIFPEYEACDPVAAGMICFFAPGTCHITPCIVPILEPADDVNRLLLMPNPGRDQVLFRSPVTGKLTVSDLAGRVWLQSEATELSEIGLGHLPEGIYVIGLVTPERDIWQVKWVKLP